jgi:hypothetical protein
MTLNAAGAVTLTGTMATAQGNFTVNGLTGVTLVRSDLVSGRALTLTTAAGAASLANVLASAQGALTVRAPGPITVSDARLFSLADLSVEGQSGLTLTRVQGTAAGAMTWRAPGDIGITESGLSAPGNLLVDTASALTVTNVRLASTGSDLTLLAGNGATIDNSALSAASLLTIRDAPGVSIGGGTTLSADLAYIEGPTITTAAVSATIGTAMLLEAPGGITNTAPLIVNARNPGVLPILLYDVRTLPLQDALTLLRSVRPDLPGVAANLQPTQVVAAAGADVPSTLFGPAVRGAGASIGLNVRTPGAVFLLLDSGNVTGTIDAGRLAVHGTGGRLSLFGRLSGLSGSEAARAAEITRPADPGSIQNYRINNCVVASINCVAIARFQPTPPVVRTVVDFSFRPGQINPIDVTIPNTGENDYE